jgi:hypothetical protein
LKGTLIFWQPYISLKSKMNTGDQGDKMLTVIDLAGEDISV